MRIRAVLKPVLLSLLLSACGAGNIDTALDVGSTSSEVTGSIPRPAEAVGTVAQETIQHVSEAGMTAIAEPEKLHTPALEQVALLKAPQPERRPESTSGKVYSQKFRDAHPINFGKVKPQHHAVHGVDVSRWQGDIDWNTLRRNGANFAFIKATDGVDHIDPMFRKNWDGADRAGIKRGAYHFFFWCRTAKDQAEWFIRNVPKVKGALPPVLDVEWNHQSSCKWKPSRAEIIEKMQVFLDRLERHYGQRPIIYTAPDFYEDNLKGAFPNHPFWLRAVAEHPSQVYPGRKWVFWQYSGSGLSSGVEGRIDLNVFHGDESAWFRWLNQNAS
ncbi:glycoside hydrolase family 25 protein [Nitratireductor basaltis]|uniref:Glycoside hydrolase n=1 Tax=Nitratireductor basaltis TaxID=472175 RepID=A0A084UBD1_9HYPH|nr:GH25 family lysozyme [Nitratireductor basaltis]KFB10267.1 Glycoside hydrolase [Nitratireductor basaltis]